MEETGVWRGMARNATGRGPRLLMSEPRSKIERAAPANAIVPEKTCRHYSLVVGIPSRAFHAPSFAFLAILSRPSLVYSPTNRHTA